MTLGNQSPKYWSCLRKRRYTRKEALAAIEEAKVNRGVQLRLYQCDYGHHWHVTHQAERKAEAA